MIAENQFDEIKMLQEICEAEESFQLKLNWEMLLTRNAEEENDFFHYENGRLVGFLGLYGFGNSVEVCGMVAPKYRRKGIFTELFAKAQNVMKDRGFTEILINAPANSVSAKGFLRTVPCKYDFTEYQMKWQETDLDEAGDVAIRPATESDLEMEINLDVQSFKRSPEDARASNLSLKQEKEQQFFMIEVEGRPVGKIRISHIDEEAWIYGFAVLPEFQGKGIGIGKSALSLVVMKEHRQGNPIFLEVEAKNAHALKLYEACGFRAYHSQDYFRLKQ